MAKDPRFNFYPDNWSGGTKRMTFEQKGAYMELLLLNFYCFSDGLNGFTEAEALSALASSVAYAELWKFLKPKFQTDGVYYWSARMCKEFHKAKKNSLEQSNRALKRWEQNPASDSASPTALPVNGCGNGSGIDSEGKGVQGERYSVEWFEKIFDPENYERITKGFPHRDVPNERNVFELKVRGSPEKYAQHTDEGIRLSFIYQLQNSTSSNGARNTDKKSIRRADATVESADFGSL